MPQSHLAAAARRRPCLHRLHRLALAAALAAAAGTPAWAALGVQLQANPNPAVPGEPLMLTFVISNTDGYDRSGVTMRMPYPAGLSSLSHGQIEGGACDGSVLFDSTCQPNEKIVWDLGTIPAGTSVTRTMPPTIAPATLPGSVITFAADVSDGSGATAATTKTIDVTASRVLQLDVGAWTPEPVVPGDALTYQLSYGHSASSAVATQALLSMAIPAGMSVLSASDGGVVSGNAVQWSLGTLNPGQTGERRVRYAVSAALPGGSAVKAQASLAADGGKLVRSETVTQFGAPPGLQAALEVNPVPAAPGEALRSALTISNPGFFNRSGVTARMRYPMGLAALSHGSIQSGSCDGSVFLDSACQPNEILEWNLGDLDAGKSVTVTLPPALGASTLPGTVIPFSVRVSDSSGATTGIHETVEATNSRVLQLNLAEVTPEPVLPGASLVYQLSWGHSASSAAAANAMLELTLPPGLDFVTASEGGSYADGKVRWSLGTLNPGQVGERRVNVLVAGNVPEGSLLKPEATLAADGGKLVRADSVTHVEGTPGLVAALDINAAPATPGEVLSAKLTVSNTSFFDRTGVTARLRYPVGLGAVSHALVESGQCDGSVFFDSACQPNEILAWDLGSLPAGRSVTLIMTPPVGTATAPGTVMPFEVQVSDSAGNTAHASESVETVNSRPLQMGISETSQEPVLPGATVSYQLAYGNTAASAASSGVTLELPVPDGLTFVSASDGGTLASGKVKWTLGTLNPAQVGRRDVQLRVNAPGSLTAGTLTKLEAVLQDSAGKLVRADDTTRIETDAALGLTLGVTPGARLPGEAVSVTFAVTNTSAFNRANVTLNLLYPQGLAALAHSATGGGTCDGSVLFDSSCQGLETLTWNLGTVPAGATVTRTFTPSVNTSVLPGSVIEFASWVADASARSRATQLLRVGTAAACDSQGGDSDADGICNAGSAPDNCTLVANADQTDSDNDGYGNRCDADFDNNGIVNNADLARFKADFGRTGAGLVTDLNGDGVVNNSDLAIFKTLFGKAPGPSGRH